MIPLVNPAIAHRKPATSQSWLGEKVRWIVVALALLATLDAAYLTYSTFTHGVVAGCDGSDIVDCDAVLASGWSRMLGFPVALGGLLCYGAVLGIALSASTRSFQESPWLGTALVAYSLLAAGSGIWFTLVQTLVLGKFCWYCLGVHLCGVLIAGLVLWAALRRPQNQLVASSSHATLATALPGGRRRASIAQSSSGPSFWVALPASGAVLAFLIAAQLLFPTRSFQASTPALNETIDMTAAAGAQSPEEDELSPTAQSYVANRVGDGESLAADVPIDERPQNSNKSRVDAVAVKDVKIAQVDRQTEPESKTALDEEAPALRRDVALLKGRLRINTYDEAVLGSPDAEHVVIELMDYTCPHCRKMHGHIREAMDRYGDQVAVVIMPVPLELECNKRITATDPIHRGACKLAKLALAVAKIGPSKFLDFHNFLLADEEKPPSSIQSVERAFRMVGSDKLRKLSKDSAIETRIQKYIGLFGKLAAENRNKKKSFGLPIQIVGDQLLSGGDMTSDEMFEAWEKELNIKPL